MSRKFTSESAAKGHAVQNIVDEIAVRDGTAFPILDIVDDLAVRYRLTAAMQRFLMWRLKFPTDSACARAVGLSKNTVPQWRRNNFTAYKGTPPDFTGAYRELMQRNRELAERSMATLGMRTVEVASELLNATKKTYVPREGKEPDVIESPDYENRYRGAQVVSNWMGEWGSKAPVQVNPVYIAIMDEFRGLIEAKKAKITEVNPE